MSLLPATTEAELRIQSDLAPLIEPATRSSRAEAVKRAVDVTLAGAAILTLAPVLAIVATTVKLTSPGPVFFAQTRVGKGGKLFRFYKFRSMVADAEVLKATLATQNQHAAAPIFKMRHDPRITRVGRFLRRYSLDELPQLLNVLRGDMSLVGPRPPVPAEVVRYEPWQLRRLSVTPGLTCIWQTSGRSNVSFDDWMKMDLQYIDSWTLRLDAKLLAKTVKAVLSAEGAY